jgi:hypothetical protein
MQNEEIYKLWTEFINDEKYKQYFISNEEEWKQKLEYCKNYIDENNKRPNERDKDINIKKIGCWLSKQITNYKTKKYIMQNEEIYNLWTEFINDEKYKEYFNTDKEY